MNYQIFRNNILVIEVQPEESSVLVQKKQTEDLVRLTFTIPNYTDLRIGDYIILTKNEQKYVLNKKPYTIEGAGDYTYECIFEGPLHELKKNKIFLQTAKIGGGFYNDYKFSLTGTAKTFLDFIVLNLNRNNPIYTAGIYKETTSLTIQFNNWNAFDAVLEITKQLGISWYLENNILNFDQKAYNSPRTLQVGRFVGLMQLTRTRVESESIETVVYGYGSTENMPPRSANEGVLTYDSPLLSENRLAFVGDNNESKLSNNVDKYGIIESVQEFDDIKPEKIGNVSAISSDVREFFDSSIEFNINDHLAPGIPPKIQFLDGKLNGLTFNISFDAATNKITMDYYTDESGQYPNSILFAEVGNTYKLFDIIMPESYITEAAQRLKQATQDYVNKKSQGLDFYDAVIDEQYILQNNVEFSIGDSVRIVSSVFQIDNIYEIKELEQNIVNPYKYSIKFGDILPKSLLNLLKSSNFSTQQSIYNIEKNSYTVNEISNQITNVIQETEWQQL